MVDITYTRRENISIILSRSDFGLLPDDLQIKLREIKAYYFQFFITKCGLRSFISVTDTSGDMWEYIAGVFLKEE